MKLRPLLLILVSAILLFLGFDRNFLRLVHFVALNLKPDTWNLELNSSPSYS